MGKYNYSLSFIIYFHDFNYYFLKIYSEGLQAIKITITTLIFSFIMHTQYGTVARCAELDWLTN